MTDNLVVSPNKSSTYQVRSNDFKIGYGDSTQVSGDWFTDDVEIGGMKMKNVSLGLGKAGKDNTGPVADGMLGLSPDNKPTVLDEMFNQGQIKSRTFSVWLNSLDSGTGNLLFGDYDYAKFADEELELVPIMYEDSWTVSFAGLVVDHDGMQESLEMQPIPILLDTGSSFSTLPPSIFDPLKDLLAVVNEEPDNDKSNSWIVPCNMKNRPGQGLFLQFGSTDGPWVNVP